MADEELPSAEDILAEVRGAVPTAVATPPSGDLPRAEDVLAEIRGTPEPAQEGIMARAGRAVSGVAQRIIRGPVEPVPPPMAEPLTGAPTVPSQAKARATPPGGGPLATPAPPSAPIPGALVPPTRQGSGEIIEPPPPEPVVAPPAPVPVARRRGPVNPDNPLNEGLGPDGKAPGVGAVRAWLDEDGVGGPVKQGVRAFVGAAGHGVERAKKAILSLGNIPLYAGPGADQPKADVPRVVGQAALNLVNGLLEAGVSPVIGVWKGAGGKLEETNPDLANRVLVDNEAVARGIRLGLMPSEIPVDRTPEELAQLGAPITVREAVEMLGMLGTVMGFGAMGRVAARRPSPGAPPPAGEAPRPGAPPSPGGLTGAAAEIRRSNVTADALGIEGVGRFESARGALYDLAAEGRMPSNMTLAEFRAWADAHEAAAHAREVGAPAIRPHIAAQLADRLVEQGASGRVDPVLLGRIDKIIAAADELNAPNSPAVARLRSVRQEAARRAAAEASKTAAAEARLAEERTTVAARGQSLVAELQRQTGRGEADPALIQTAENIWAWNVRGPQAGAPWVQELRRALDAAKERRPTATAEPVSPPAPGQFVPARPTVAPAEPTLPGGGGGLPVAGAVPIQPSPASATPPTTPTAEQADESARALERAAAHLPKAEDVVTEVRGEPAAPEPVQEDAAPDEEPQAEPVVPAAGPAPTVARGPLTIEAVDAALGRAGGDWLRAAKTLSGSEDPKVLTKMVNRAARLSTAYKAARGPKDLLIPEIVKALAAKPRTMKQQQAFAKLAAARTAAKAERERISMEGFDPNDDEHLTRFVLDNGGLSSGDDLVGEWGAIPSRFKRRKGQGLTPSEMAERINEAVGGGPNTNVINDGELLRRLAKSPGKAEQKKASERASALAEERDAKLHEAVDTFEGADRPQQVTFMQRAFGITAQQAEALLNEQAKRRAEESFDPAAFEAQDEMEQALVGLFRDFPEEVASPLLFDFLAGGGPKIPDLRGRFGTTEEVAARLFGGDVGALGRFVEQAKAKAGGQANGSTSNAPPVMRQDSPRYGAARPGRLYHTTTMDRLPSISAEGLRPGKRGAVSKASGAAEDNSKGRLFFADNPEAAAVWHNEVRDTVNVGGKASPRSTPVALRVTDHKTARDELGDFRTQGSRYSRQHVPPDRIEYWHPERGWTPVSRWSELPPSVDGYAPDWKAEAGGAPRTERTPEGDQSLIEGTPKREQPRGKSRAKTTQRDFLATPLGQAMQREKDAAQQRGLFDAQESAAEATEKAADAQAKAAKAQESAAKSIQQAAKALTDAIPEAPRVEESPPTPKPAPVRWAFWQERMGGKPPLEQWNLLEDIPGHVKDSTLSRETLEREGYTVPQPPEAPPAAPPEHRYSSTEIRLPAGLSDAVRALAKKIPAEEKMKAGAEVVPHVTVRYGIQSVDPDRIKDALAGAGPVEITLGPLKTFPDTGEGEVLYAEVESPALDSLHEQLTDNLTVVETKPGRYVPHVTIALLKPGQAKQYEGERALAGRTFTATEVVFTPRDGAEPTVIPLRVTQPGVALNATPPPVSGPAGPEARPATAPSPNIIREPETPYGDPTDPPEVKAATEALRQRDVASEPAFQRWFGDSEMVTPDGQPKPYYRGDYRGDRLGGRLRKGRARSAAGFFFTDDPTIASNYAKNKPDADYAEQVNEGGDFRGWFRFKTPGYRGTVDLHQLWYHLSPEQKARVEDVVRKSDYTEERPDGSIGPRYWDFTGEHPARDKGGWDYEARDARGNWLDAAAGTYLGGAILNGDDDEALFLDLLKEAGITGEYTPPYAEASTVTPVYLSIKHALNTADVPPEVIERLRAVARRSRRRPGLGHDQWDIRTTTPRDFMERLDEDLKNGTTHAWTSIPKEIVQALQAMGYDGIRDRGGKGGGTTHEVVVAFEPNQVKSVWNRGTWDPGSDMLVREEDARYGEPEPVPPFFSALQRAAEQKLPARASAAQIMGTLKTAQGVKADEIKWTYLAEWLADQKGPVAKQDVLDYLRDYGVKIIEDLRGGEVDPEDEARRSFTVAFRAAARPDPDPALVARLAPSLGTRFLPAWQINGPEGYVILATIDRTAGPSRSDDNWRTAVAFGEATPDEFWAVKEDGRVVAGAPAADLDEAITQAERDHFGPRGWARTGGRTTQYEAYMPVKGGSRYRELLFVYEPSGSPPPGPPVPEPLTALPEGWHTIRDMNQPPERRWGVIPADQQHARFFNDYHAPSPEAAINYALGHLNFQRQDVHERRERERLSAWSTRYTAPHFNSQKNLVAHVRFDERLDDQGRRGILILEVQDDLDNEIRKKQGRLKKAEEELAAKGDAELTDDWKRRARNEIEEIRAEIARLEALLPFRSGKSNELVLKRMLRWAAEHDYEWLGLTTGDQQNKLYSLSNVVDRITYDQVGRTGTLEGYKDGQRVFRRDMSRDEVDEYIGEEVAARLFNSPERQGDGRVFGDAFILEGLDLEVGGAGKRKAYDVILPAILDKLAKPWGVRGSRQPERRWKPFLDSRSVEKYAGLALDPMDRGMGAATENHQVLQSVVRALPVDVVDLLARKRISAEDFSRNPKMFADAFSVDSRAAITSGLRRALSETGARLRTGLDSAYQARLDEEVLPALRASDIDTNVAAGVLFPELLHVLSGSVTGDVGVGLPRADLSAEPRVAPMALGGGKGGAAKLTDFVEWHHSLAPHVSSDLVIPEMWRMYLTTEMRTSVLKTGFALFEQQPRYGLPVARAAEKLPPRSTPEQVGRILRKEPGVTEAMLHRLGMPEWLADQTGPVTREQVMGRIMGRAPLVADVLAPPIWDPDAEEAARRAAKEIADGYVVREGEDEALARRMGEVALTRAIRAAREARSLRAEARQLGLTFHGAGDLRHDPLRVLATRPAAKPGATRPGVKTLALAIPAEIKKGVVNLAEQPLGPNPLEKLAYLAQPLRFPLWETLRIIAVDKDGQVVGHRATTSRLPGAVVVFEVGWHDDHVGYIAHLAEWLKSIGAAGYYLMHNHPSGDPKPSAPDLDMTGFFFAHLPGYKGHVVINSGKYGTILTPTNIVRRKRAADEPHQRKTRGLRQIVAGGIMLTSTLGDDTVRMTFEGWGIDPGGYLARLPGAEPSIHPLDVADPYLDQGVPHSLNRQRIYGPALLARAGKAMERAAPNTVILFYAHSGNIVAIEAMDASRFTGRGNFQQASAEIQAGMRQYGASGVVSYAPWNIGGTAQPHLGSEVRLAATWLMSEGVLVDHVMGGNESRADYDLYEKGYKAASDPPFVRIAENTGSLRVEQPSERYGDEEIDVDAHLDVIGRLVLGQHRGYPEWSASMRQRVTPAFHSRLPETYGRLTGTAPGGEGVEPPAQDVGRPEAGGPQAPTPETPPRAEPTTGPRMATNINLDKWESPEDILRMMEDLGAMHAGPIEAQRRGRISHAELREMAQSIGLTDEEVLSAPPGTILNPERMLKARLLVASAAERLYELQAAAANINAGPEDLANLARGMTRFMAMYQTLAGHTAEAGRLLNQQKIKVRSIEEWKRLIDAAGGEDSVRDAAALLARTPPENLPAVRGAVRLVAGKHPLADLLYWLWINGLLSGPHTYVVNAASNTLFWAQKGFVDRIAAAGVDWARGAVTGNPRERYAFEAVAESYALPQGIREGVAAFAESWSTGRRVFGAGPIELHRPDPLTGKARRIFGHPTQIMQAADELAKAIGYRTSLHALAFREAAKEGLRGQAIWQRAAAIVVEINQGPPARAEGAPDEGGQLPLWRWQPLVEAASHEAHVRTFTDDPPEWIKEIIKFRDKLPWFVPLRYVIPFIRTPSRIFAQAYNYSPLKWLEIIGREPLWWLRRRQYTRRAAGGGGQGAGGGGRPGGPPGGLPPGPPPPKPPRGGDWSDEAARAFVGTMLSGFMVIMASLSIEYEYITGGGPADEGERRVKRRATGWQPYSAWTPWGYFGWRRMDPHSTMLSISVDLLESGRDPLKNEAAEYPARLTNAINEVALDKSFLTGLRDASKGIAEANRYGQRWWQGLAASLVPSLFGQTAALLDPYQREARSMRESMQRKVPIASRALRPALDVFGEPIERGLLERLSRFALPIDISPLKNDPVAKELVRLRVGIRRPRYSGGKLEPDEQYEFERMAGAYTHEGLARLMESGGYGTKDIIAQRDAVKDAVTAATRKASREIADALGKDEVERRKAVKALQSLPPTLR